MCKECHRRITSITELDLHRIRHWHPLRQERTQICSLREAPPAANSTSEACQVSFWQPIWQVGASPTIGFPPLSLVGSNSSSSPAKHGYLVQILKVGMDLKGLVMPLDLRPEPSHVCIWASQCQHMENHQIKHRGVQEPVNTQIFAVRIIVLQVADRCPRQIKSGHEDFSAAGKAFQAAGE